MHHVLPHHLCMDLLMWTFLFGLVGSFGLLAEAYASSQPLVLLVMPVVVASALIVLVHVHDRRVMSA